MKHNYFLAIGAALGLAVLTACPAAAQNELPNRPDPSTAPPRPAAPVYPAAPAAPAIPHFYPTSALGLEIGWGAPYGWGFEYAHMVSSHVDVNAGLGIGVGGKIGVGARYYVRPDRPVSFYMGANLARSGRVGNVDLELNGEQARYSMNPSGVLHLRGGMRWQPGSVGLLASLGYGVRFTGDPVVFDTYSYGQPSADMRNLVDVISPGGLEISIGVLFGLGRR
jgi:hypothetical protein